MAAPLILARTFKDAHAYARETLGLSFGNYRVVNSVGTLKATRGADLHLVPGWDKRPDRFTMKGALRYARHNIIDVAAQAQEPAPFVEVDGVLTTVGCADAIASSGYPNDARTHTIALRYNSLRDLLSPRVPVWTVTAVPDDTPVPQTHLDLVAKVLPDSNTLETDFFDGVVAEENADPLPEPTCIDCGLDPHGPECPQYDEPKPEPVAEPAEAPKKRRRRKCADCEQLHYKGDPCIDSEAV